MKNPQPQIVGSEKVKDKQQIQLSEAKTSIKCFIRMVQLSQTWMVRIL